MRSSSLSKIFQIQKAMTPPVEFPTLPPSSPEMWLSNVHAGSEQQRAVWPFVDAVLEEAARQLISLTGTEQLNDAETLALKTLCTAKELPITLIEKTLKSTKGTHKIHSLIVSLEQKLRLTLGQKFELRVRDSSLALTGLSKLRVI